MTVAGIAVLVLGTAAAGARGTPALLAGLRLQAVGLAAIGVGGGIALFSGSTAGAGFTSEFQPAVGVDALSGAFLLMLAVVGVPAAVHAGGALPRASHPRALGMLTGLFPLALTGVLVARDATLLLASWELMTLVPAAAILVAHGDAGGRRTVFEYLAITHIGGAGVWVAVLLLAHHGALGNPAGLAAADAGTQALVAVAGLIGFGTKAGLVPLHAWLPRAHPVAPSHISALMSGVMVKVALYGAVRLVFEWLGGPGPAVGLALMATGAVSALAGVLYALFQTDLKRLLAFSTIENVGVIAVLLGAAAVFAERGEDAWAALSMGAALLHALAHAAVKGLLFLGAGAIERGAGGLAIDRMGGLLRRMPWTGAAFLLGVLTIAGLPATAGFASEWTAFQALFGLAGQDDVVVAVTGGLAIAVLGMTIGLGALCFARVAGLVLMGRPRSPGAADAREVTVPLRAGAVALAAACTLLGLVPGLVLPPLAAVAPGQATLPRGAGISVAGTTLPAPGVAVTLAVGVALLYAARRRRPVAAPAPAWACGQPHDARLAWTSAAFTKPVLMVLTPVLRPEREVAVEVRDGTVRGIRHRSAVPHLFDALLYAPVERLALRGASRARRLQSGSLRTYLAYLVGLVVLLLLLARIGALG